MATVIVTTDRAARGEALPGDPVVYVRDVDPAEGTLRIECSESPHCPPDIEPEREWWGFEDAVQAAIVHVENHERSA